MAARCGVIDREQLPTDPPGRAEQELLNARERLAAPHPVSDSRWYHKGRAEGQDGHRRSGPRRLAAVVAHAAGGRVHGGSRSSRADLPRSDDVEQGGQVHVHADRHRRVAAREPARGHDHAWPQPAPSPPYSGIGGRG
jgi:hypothetical protein